MNPSDDRSRQQGGQQGSMQQGQQQGTQQQQQEQYSQGSSQQGSTMRRSMPTTWFGGRPLEMFRRLDEDMDRLFHQFWGRSGRAMSGRGSADLQTMWMPDLDVCEKDGKLHVYADLPGMSKEDVHLSIEGDQLIIRGERRSQHEQGERGGNYYLSERSYGSFYRSIALPEGVDPQTVDATFKDGVLDVSFDAPRGTQQEQARKIDIR